MFICELGTGCLQLVTTSCLRALWFSEQPRRREGNLTLQGVLTPGLGAAHLPHRLHIKNIGLGETLRTSSLADCQLRVLLWPAGAAG